MSLEKELKNSTKSHKYPTIIRFDEDELPELTKWKVGAKYTLTLEVEQMSLSKDGEYGDVSGKEKPKTRASFKVVSVSPLSASASNAKRPTLLSEALRKRA